MTDLQKRLYEKCLSSQTETITTTTNTNTNTSNQNINFDELNLNLNNLNQFFDVLEQNKEDLVGINFNSLN